MCSSDLALIGSLDDLNTVAGIINRDGDVEEWRESQTGGHYPFIEPARSQNLLDSVAEAHGLITLLELSPLQADLRAASTDKRMAVLSPLIDRWFGEWAAIIARHDSDVWPRLRPHRRAVGNPLD